MIPLQKKRWRRGDWNWVDGYSIVLYGVTNAPVCLFGLHQVVDKKVRLPAHAW